MKLIPLSNYILVEQEKAEEITKGGIILPQQIQEKPNIGKVIEVGPGALDENHKVIPMSLKPGDKIMFGKFAGNKVNLNEVELLLMKETDVMGVLIGG
jgi:chaperonin GroES